MVGCGISFSRFEVGEVGTKVSGCVGVDVLLDRSREVEAFIGSLLSLLLQ